MSALRTSCLLALAFIGLAPRGALAMECACTITAGSGPEACETREAVRESLLEAREAECESVEDCASLVPFSYPSTRAVPRLDLNLAQRAQHPGLLGGRTAKLSWCERATDPECSEADPRPSGNPRVALWAAAIAPDVFAVPPARGPVLRSTKQTRNEESLAGVTPARRLDRPPR